MYCSPIPQTKSKRALLVMVAVVVLGNPAAYAADLEQANECLTLQTQPEKEACLRMYIDQQKLLNELRNEINEGQPKPEEETEVHYDLPQPIGFYRGPRSPVYVEFAYKGGVISGQKGDLLVSGWRIKDVSKTSVVLARDGKQVVLGYGGDESTGSEGVPLVPPPAPMSPAPTQSVSRQ